MSDMPNPFLDTHALMSLLDTSSEGIIALDRSRRVVCWNAAAERIYGYQAQEAIGMGLDALLDAGDLPTQRIFERAEHGAKSEGVEGIHKRANGSHIDVVMNAGPILGERDAVTGIILFVWDATESRVAAQRLAALEAFEEDKGVVLETASRVALDILASRTGVEALRHIADAARTLARAQYAALGVARPDGQGLLEFVTVGLTAEEEAAIGPRPHGAGILGLLLRRSEPLRMDVLADHPNTHGFPPNHPPMDSFLGVPIRQGETILGSLYLTNKQGEERFSEADEIAVQALGAHAAVAIHNLQMLSRQRALVSGLINAQEEERRAVAYDLHDGLTQFVMASHMHMEAFKIAYHKGNAERAMREMDKGLRYLGDAVIESRRLVNGLRSLALDDLGLAGALEQLFAEEKTRAGWTEAEFLHNIADERFDKTLETAVYRVAQEALTNIRKHAGAGRVRLMLLSEPAALDDFMQLALDVRDWGGGFEPDQRIDDYAHVGLQGMEERARLMGGSFAVHSRSGEGTQIHAVFPVIR
jgi:PAS domain S-box-containing protein